METEFHVPYRQLFKDLGRLSFPDADIAVRCKYHHLTIFFHGE